MKRWTWRADACNQIESPPAWGGISEFILNMWGPVFGTMMSFSGLLKFVLISLEGPLEGPSSESRALFAGLLADLKTLRGTGNDQASAQTAN